MCKIFKQTYEIHDKACTAACVVLTEKETMDLQHTLDQEKSESLKVKHASLGLGSLVMGEVRE